MFCFYNPPTREERDGGAPVRAQLPPLRRGRAAHGQGRSARGSPLRARRGPATGARGLQGPLRKCPHASPGPRCVRSTHLLTPAHARGGPQNARPSGLAAPSSTGARRRLGRRVSTATGGSRRWRLPPRGLGELSNGARGRRPVGGRARRPARPRRRQRQRVNHPPGSLTRPGLGRPPEAPCPAQRPPPGPGARVRTQQVHRAPHPAAPRSRLPPGSCAVSPPRWRRPASGSGEE